MRFALPLVAAATSFALAGCNSNFFKITKENEPAPASAPPPAEQPARPPVRAAADSGRAAGAARPATSPPPAPVSSAVSTPAGTAADAFDPEPPPVASDSAGVERLVHLAMVWSATAHFHPYVTTFGVPLDSALVRAVPAVRAARSPEQLRTALTQFLSVLGDAATTVVPPDAAPVESFPSRTIGNLTTADGMLVVRLPTDQLRADEGTRTALREIAERARNFTRVVIDLRASARRFTGGDDIADAPATWLAEALTTERLAAPRLQRRVVGTMYDDPPAWFAIGGAPAAWRAESPFAMVGSGALVTAAAPPPRRGRNAQTTPPPLVPRHIAIVANRNTIVPRALLALVASGQASLFAEGTLPADAAMSYDMPGVGSARLRTAMYTDANGAPALRVDSAFDASTIGDSTAPAVRAAFAAVRAGRMPRATPRSLHIAPALPPAFDSAAYPTMGARVLGVFRTWSAMRTLHAHRDSYDDDLDEVFRRAIRKAEAATNAVEYARALLELIVSTDDSGVRTRGMAFELARGEFAIPLRARWIEGRPVVTAIAADPARRVEGIAVGDEITAIDGFPVAAWLGEVRRTVPASNDWMRTDAVMETMRRGQSSTVLRVRDARGAERTLNVPRSVRFDDTSVFAHPTMPPIRELSPGIRYIDATTPGPTGNEFAAVLGNSTQAVLVDLRGPLASRTEGLSMLAVPPVGQAVTRIVRRGASQPCFAASLRLARLECVDERAEQAIFLPSGSALPFAGLIAVLVDERTDAGAELLALQLEASGARLLGTPTAGAMANASWLSLPGRLAVAMPLYEMRTGDNAQVHRVGLTPSVTIAPTIRGVRNGVDDVLERVHQWVQQELNPAPRRRR